MYRWFLSCKLTHAGFLVPCVFNQLIFNDFLFIDEIWYCIFEKICYCTVVPFSTFKIILSSHLMITYFVEHYAIKLSWYFLSLYVCYVQETLLIHKDLLKTEGLNDILLELKTEGLICNFKLTVLPTLISKKIFNQLVSSARSFVMWHCFWNSKGSMCMEGIPKSFLCRIFTIL